MRTITFLLVSLASSLPLLSSIVDGHAILMNPVPRVVYKAEEYPPKNYFPVDYESCAGGNQPDPGAQPPKITWTAGQTVLLEWSTTIPHTASPGVRVAMKYSAADKFANNILVKSLTAGPDGFNGIFVTLPNNKSGATAILQWIWESTQDGGFYISCVDVNVQPYTAAAVTAPDAATQQRVNTVFRTRDLEYSLTDPSLTNQPDDPPGLVMPADAASLPPYGTKSVSTPTQPAPQPTIQPTTPITNVITTPQQPAYQNPATQYQNPGTQSSTVYSQGNIVSSANYVASTMAVVAATASVMVRIFLF